MRYKRQVTIILSLVAVIAISQCTKADHSEVVVSDLSKAHRGEQNKDLVEQGKQIFRYDAFGDEDFWSGILHTDKAIAGSSNEGFGAGVSPVTALSVGLKVDIGVLQSIAYFFKKIILYFVLLRETANVRRSFIGI